MAAVACVPAGVVSASAEPSSWHTGVVLVGVGVGVGIVLRFCCPFTSALREPSTHLSAANANQR